MKSEARLALLLIVAGCAANGVAPPAEPSLQARTAQKAQIGAPVPVDLLVQVDVPMPDGCAAESEQLQSAVAVRSAPDAAGHIVETLAAGRYLLRCATRAEYQFVRFPAAGEKVDCSTRPAGRRCNGGWIPAATATRTFD